MAATITVAEINRLHARFWSEKTAKLEALLTETILRERVFEALKGEIARGVPRDRHSVEGQFEEFSALRRRSGAPTELRADGPVEGIDSSDLSKIWCGSIRS